MRNVNVLTLAFLINATASGCGASEPGGKSSESDDEVIVEDEKPADSTGAVGKLSFGFATTDVNALALKDGDLGTSTDTATATTSDTATSTDTAATPTLKISDNLTLTTARFNIAVIKLKARVARHAAEEQLEKEDLIEEAADASEVEKAAEADAAEGNALAGKSDASKAGDTKGSKADDAGMTGLKGAAKQLERLAKLAARRHDFASKEHERGERCARRDRNTRFVGPYIYDAIAGKIEGTVPAIELADGTYKRIEFKLKRSFDVAADDPLLGNVFVLQGTVMKDGVATRFEIDWHVALNFRLFGDGAIAVAPGVDNRLALVFDLARWFDDLDIADATADDDGVIRINKGSNRELLHQLHRRMKAGVRFGKDSNYDNKLVPDETAGAGVDVPDATIE